MKTVSPPKIISILFVAISFTAGCQKNVAAVSDNVVDTVDSTLPKIDSTLYTISGVGGVDDGEILLSLNTNSSEVGHLLVLDKDGYIIKEKTAAARADNFQKWVIGGQTYYSYLLAEGDYAIGGAGTEEGYDI